MEKLTDSRKQDLLNSYLFKALETGTTDEIQLFVEMGADVNHESRVRFENKAATSMTPLNFAAMNGHGPAVISYLLTHGAKMDTFDDHYQLSPLAHAVSCNSYNTKHVIKLLLEAGCPVDIKSDKGEAAIHVATRLENLELIQILVEHGADIDLKDDEGLSPLHIATSKGNAELFKYFIEKGANVNSADNRGETVLITAIRHGYLAISNKLITLCNNIDAQSSFGNTALHYATSKKLNNQVTKLLGKKANPNLVNNEGKTPLFSCLSLASPEDIENASNLLNAGADVNSMDTDGDNVLMSVIQATNGLTSITNKRVNLANKLIERIADGINDFSTKNKKDKTALDLAINTKNESLIAMIECRTLSSSIEKAPESGHGLAF